MQTEINVKLDAMVAAGTMSELIAPYVASGLPAEVAEQIGDVVAAQIGPVVAAQISAVVADQLPAVAAAAAAQEVSAWLALHVDPDTGYVIDDTFTIQGAAADAKAVGDEFTAIKSALTQTQNTLYDSYSIQHNIQTTQGTSISRSTEQQVVSVPANTKVSISVSSTVINAGLNIYYSSDGGTSWTLGTTVTNGNTRSFTPTSAVNLLGFYIEGTNVTGTGIVYVTITIGEYTDKIGTMQTNISSLQSYIANKVDKKIMSAITGYIDLEVKENWIDGFYRSNGTYSEPTLSGKEKTTDWLDKSINDTIWIDYDANSESEGKLYINEFNSNKTFIQRIEVTLVSNKFDGSYTFGTGVSYVRISCRYYDTASFNVYSYSIVNDIEEKLDSMPQIIPPMLSTTVKTIAHRGDMIDAPQCTAPSYIIARMHGNDFAENDLALSEDSEYVMWHDTSLAKLGNLVDINGYLIYTDGTDLYYVDGDDNVYTWDGSDYVASAVALETLTRCAGSNYNVNSDGGKIGLTLAQLKRIDFGAYKGDKFIGTQILTFAEWVLLCKQLGMAIYVDHKLTYTDTIIDDAAEIVADYGMGTKSTWLGLNALQVARLRTTIPNARCGVFGMPSQAVIESFTPLNIDNSIFFTDNVKEYDGSTQAKIKATIEAGFEVEAYLVEISEMTKQQVFDGIKLAISYGVVGVTTDHYRVDEVYADMFAPYLS